VPGLRAMCVLIPRKKFHLLPVKLLKTHTTENSKNELKELNELWNMKEMQMENAEKSFTDLW